MGVILTEEITEKDQWDAIDEIYPTGWYDMKIVQTEQKETRDGKFYLSITCEVLGPGKFKGKTKRLPFWIYDGKEAAIGINRSNLFRLSKSCGVNKLKNTSAIEGKKFRIMLEEGVYNNKPVNQMKGFSPYIETKEEEVKKEEIKTPPKNVQPEPSVNHDHNEEEDDEDIPF